MSKRKANITEEQLIEYYEAFCHFDKDNSGVINISELGAVLRTLGQDLDEVELQEKMEEIDQDGSGSIDFKEFAEMMNDIMNQEVTVEEIKSAFEVLDTTKKGYMTPDELRYILTTKGDKFTIEEANEMIEAADLNGDGEIEYQEVATYLTSN